MSVLKLKDFSLVTRGSSSKLLGYKDNIGGSHRIITWDPIIRSRHFEFHIMMHSFPKFGVSKTGIEKKGHFMGSKDSHWTIGYDGHMYHKNVCGSKTMEDFGKGDKVGMIVNKDEKKIYYIKNGKNLGSIKRYEGMLLPDELVIASGTRWKDTEIQLIFFKDHSAEEPSSAESSETEEEFVPEEYFQREMKKMKDLMKNMNDKHEADILALKKENEDLGKLVKLNEEENKKKYEELLSDHKLLEQKYNEHNGKYHTINYTIDSFISIPKMMAKENEEFACFVGKFEIEILFSMFSCGVKDDDNAIDFTNLKVMLDDTKIQENRMPRSVELELDLQKVGKRELLVEFENIKKIFIINVCSSDISEEKTEIILRKANSEEENEEFSVKDEIEFLIQFKNEEGLNLPFKSIPDMEMSYIISGKTSKKIRGFVDLEEENYEGDGKLNSGSFKLKEGTEGGEFKIVVLGFKFSKKKEFFLK